MKAPADHRTTDATRPRRAHQTHQAVIEWGRNPVERPTGKLSGGELLHQLFEARAAADPAAEAVVALGKRLTYGQLEARANRLARRLRELGVGPEVVVGLHLDTSVAIPVAVLAVLKAGGAYLPLDPHAPEERLALLTERSGARVVVSAAADLPWLPEGAEALAPGDDGEAAVDDPGPPGPIPGLTPEALALVIFTSGSTGTPKGVMLPHRSLVDISHAYRLAYGLGSRIRRHGQVAAFSFAVFQADLVRALTTGGCLVLAHRDEITSPPRLADLLERERVEMVEFVPTVLRFLVRHLLAEGRTLPSMATVVVGSDRWYVREHRALEGAFRGEGDGEMPFEAIHAFGLTETSIDTALFTDDPEPLREDHLMPIGRPFANVEILLLGSDTLEGVVGDPSEPVPPGETGELVVGGAGVTRGFLGEPRRTAERFVPHPGPAPPHPGARVYRTGDLARHLPDGNVEFLGRADHQVKIRGYRVELGEVEAVLEEHPAVAQAVVVARQDAWGERYLVAYGLAAEGEAKPEPEELRRLLARRLPAPLVPPVVVVLDALPLTDSGKVNRQALPDPETLGGDGELPEGFAPPETPVEGVIAAIWAEVLSDAGQGRRAVGRDDDFFVLGGHSLAAMQVLARLRDAFGVDLAVGEMFEASTVAALARRVEEALASGDGAVGDTGALTRADGSARSSPGGRQVRRLPLSFSQQRLWFFDQMRPGSPAYNLPATRPLSGPWVERLAEPAGRRVLARALGEVVRRHEALRTTFETEAGRPVQVVAPPPPEGWEPELPYVDLAAGRKSAAAGVSRRGVAEHGVSEHSVSEHIEAESLRGFDLGRGVGGGVDGEAGQGLVSWKLLRLDRRHMLLVVVMHHIVSDGWSVGVFFRELDLLLQAFAAGKPSPLPELPIQYADWAVWQRQQLEGKAVEAQLAHWRRALAGAPTLFELPMDRPRPPVQSFRGATRTFAFRGGPARGDGAEVGLAEAASRRGRGHGATPYMVYLAAFLTVLHRWSGRTDLVVGTPVAGRTRPEIEGLIGFFVNTLVVRQDLEAVERGGGDTGGGDTGGGDGAEGAGQVASELSFAELLAAVRRTALGAFAHQELPFEKLVEELAPERSLAWPPLFQIMFVLLNTPDFLRSPGFEVAGDGRGRGGPRGRRGRGREEAGAPATSEAAAGLSRFDLTLFLTEDSGELGGAVEYSTDLFDAATIARLAGHFAVLLGAALERPETSLAALPLLTGAEERELARGLGARPLPRPLPLPGRKLLPLHEMFAAQAERRGGAEALVAGPVRLTYRQLAARADALARRLAALGVGPEVPVALCAERGAELVVGLLGILRAGGAYVPLDPSYPEDRLAFMVEDSGAPVLVTQRAMLERVLSRLPLGEGGAGERGVRVVELDEVLAPFEEDPRAEASTASAASEPWTPPRVPLASLAYVIYTSGSTGRPKGVMIDHGNAAALVAWGAEVYPALSLRGMLFATSVCFDPSVYELFCALGLGGKLVVAENALALASLPARDEVTLLNTVPSVLTEILRGGGVPASVEVINVGGEPVHRELVEQAYRETAARRVVVVYGPTEDTIYSSISPQEPGEVGVPAIGPPIHGSEAYVVDRDLRLVPQGVPGELLMGGAGVARGYLGRASLTAERFVPDPFLPSVASAPGRRGRGVQGRVEGEVRGRRLYRTGDLVRFRTDGQLEFLGRIDHQVKVRGFRVELGEIETALSRHPAVAETVVLARQDSPGDKRLVAYWTSAGQVEDGAGAGEAPGVEELRRFLGQSLPGYMVPSAFIHLPALPRQPNGKVSRKALPAPEAERPDLDAGFVAPRTPLEETLAAIWSEVLGVSPIGVHDDFFQLGGHSLLATQMIARARSVADIDLILPDLFEAPTVAALARRIAEGAEGGEGREAGPPLLPVPRDGDLPLSFAQQRLWFLDQLSGGDALHQAVYNIAVVLPLALPLAASGGERVDPEILEAALEVLVRRHETLRTTFPAVAGRPVQRVGPPRAQRRLKVVDLSGERNPRAVAGHLAASYAREPFDLVEGPLLRAVMLRFARPTRRGLGPRGGPRGTEPGAPAGGPTAAPADALVLVMHHIISDGWSVGVLTRELSTVYQQLAEGRPAHLPPLPIQYGDWAAWQRRTLRGPYLERLLAWWRERLEGAPALPGLPTDRPRPAALTASGATQRFRLAPGLTPALHRRAETRGVTPFMAYLALYGLLLSKLSGRTDLVVGTAVAKRTRAEVENLIGVFVDTLVLRLDLSGDPTFDELLERTRALCLEAFAHQDLPFERLVAELAPDRTLTRSPLFQVAFVLQNLDGGAGSGAGRGGRSGRRGPFTGQEAGFDGRTSGVLPGTTHFDLTLSVEEVLDPTGAEGRGGAGDGTERAKGRGAAPGAAAPSAAAPGAAVPGAAVPGTVLITGWEYSTDLFDATTIARWAGGFEALLEGVLADGARPVSALGAATAAERHQVLVEWNDEPLVEESGRWSPGLFHGGVARWARERPDAPALDLTALDREALVERFRGIAGAAEGAGTDAESLAAELAQAFEEGVLSWRQLHGLAERVGAHLRALGVRPEDRVGLFAERSAELILGLLGILEAGAAYVPLALAYPPERLAAILEDAGATLLVTRSTLEGRWPARGGEAAGPPRLCLDRAWPAVLAANPAEGAASAWPRPESLAYVIYTSGSTGRPKGVEVEHRSAHNTVAAYRHLCGLTGDDRMLQFFTPAWDGSVLEMGMAFEAGAALCLGPDERLLPGPEYVELVEELAVTAAIQPPSALAVLPADRCRELAMILSGGDACSADIVGRWAPGRRLYNGYGPTEIGILCAGTRLEVPETPPIGRPHPGIALVVVDRRLRPVPLGVEGELVVAGIGVARGYGGRPALTAEKFVPDPFPGLGALAELWPEAARGGTRLYRTGDLVRWRRDGKLDFLGRIDSQVKLRGFRIELGEIETALLRHPEVETGLVMVREDRPGDRRLVAYVVPSAAAGRASGASEAELEGELRRALARDLPGYMVPSAFVVLGSLPTRTQGNKVDRSALPAPAAPVAGEEGSAPVGPVEETIASVFAALLGLAADDLAAGRGEPTLSREDDFFELGGHSLLATQAVARLRDAFRVALTVADLFENPTVAALARRVEELTGERGGPGGSGPAGADRLPPLLPAPRAAATGLPGPLPLTWGQQRLWLQERLAAGSAAYTIPAVLPLDGVTGRLGEGSPGSRRSRLERALGAALLALMGRHEALRTRIEEVEGRPVQQVEALPARPPLETLSPRAIRRHRTGSGSLQGVLLEVFTGHARELADLSRAPLFRSTLIPAGELASGAAEGDGSAEGTEAPEGSFLLALTFHHILFDGWSLGVVRRELGALLAAALEGTTRARPERHRELAAAAGLGGPPVQLGDFAVWQRGLWSAAGGDRAWEAEAPALAAEHLAHWRRALEGVPPVLPLATDHPRPERPSIEGGRLTFTWGTATTRAIRRLARRRDATLFMVCLAAWGRLLAARAGVRRLAVGTDVANRIPPATEGSVGLFINQLVIPLDLRAGDGAEDGGVEELPPAELLARVRRATLDAYAHQGLPFERLAAELVPSPDLATPPLVQVKIVLQNTDGPRAAERAAGGATGGAEGRSAEVEAGDGGEDEPRDRIADHLEPATPQLDLALYLTDLTDRIEGALLLRTDLFEPATAVELIEGLRDHLEVLLSAGGGEAEVDGPSEGALTGAPQG